MLKLKNVSFKGIIYYYIKLKIYDIIIMQQSKLNSISQRKTEEVKWYFASLTLNSLLPFSSFVWLLVVDASDPRRLANPGNLFSKNRDMAAVIVLIKRVRRKERKLNLKIDLRQALVEKYPFFWQLNFRLQFCFLNEHIKLQA